jgi:hypothetical protein
MFEMHDRRTGRMRTVYGVHKSGPRDEQTKFLIYANGWRWVWAKYFVPRAQAATVADLAQSVDLLTNVGERTEQPQTLAG